MWPCASGHWRGASLSEWGLTEKDGGAPVEVAIASEAELFAFLDVPEVRRSCARAGRAGGR